MLLLPPPTLLWPEILPFALSAPLEQCHILCDNSQPDFTTLLVTDVISALALEEVPEAHLSLCLLSSLPPCCISSSSCVLLELTLPAGSQSQFGFAKRSRHKTGTACLGYWEQFVARVQCIPGQLASSLALWGHSSLFSSPGPICSCLARSCDGWVLY